MFLSTCGPTRPAGDAAGVSRNLAFFSTLSRAITRLDLSTLPAAHLRAIVGPLSHHGSCRTNEPMTPLRHTVRKSPGSRT